MPFIMGFEQPAGDEPNDIPLEIMKVNLNTNKIQFNETLPKLPSAEGKVLLSKLRLAVPFTANRPDPILESVDQAFNLVLIDPDDILEFDHLAVRDAVFEFISKMLKGYEQHVVMAVRMARIDTEGDR